MVLCGVQMQWKTSTKQLRLTVNVPHIQHIHVTSSHNIQGRFPFPHARLHVRSHKCFNGSQIQVFTFGLIKQYEACFEAEKSRLLTFL